MPSQRKDEPDNDPYVSVYAAAHRLGIATKTVLARVVGGELEGKQVAGRIVITRESVERLRKQRKQASVA